MVRFWSFLGFSLLVRHQLYVFTESSFYPVKRRFLDDWYCVEYSEKSKCIEVIWYLVSQSEDHLIVIPLVDCDSPFGLLPLWNLNIFFFHFVGRKIWSEQRINIRCFHKTIKTKRSNGKEWISRCTTIEGLQRWCLSRSTIGRLWTGSLPTDCRPNLLTMLVFSGNIMSTI